MVLNGAYINGELGTNNATSIVGWNEAPYLGPEEMGAKGTFEAGKHSLGWLFASRN